MDDLPALLTIGNGVATLTLNRPESMNAVNAAMHDALRGILDRLEKTETIAALILTGAGKAFCAGQDLIERRDMLRQGDVDLHASLEENYNPLVRRLTALPFPTIAAVNGVAAGAGAAIALGCDIVIASENARFQFAFAKVALGPDSGTSYILPRLIGEARAIALALTAEPVDARTAANWGMIWQAMPAAELMPKAYALAEGFTKSPRTALAAIKSQMRATSGKSLDACLDAERNFQGRLGLHPDYREAVTAFAEKRRPNFTRNYPAGEKQ